MDSSEKDLEVGKIDEPSKISLKKEFAKMGVDDNQPQNNQRKSLEMDRQSREDRDRLPFGTPESSKEPVGSFTSTPAKKPDSLMDTPTHRHFQTIESPSDQFALDPDSGRSPDDLRQRQEGSSSKGHQMIPLDEAERAIERAVKRAVERAVERAVQIFEDRL